MADSKRAAGDATLVNISSPEHVMHPILFLQYATLDRMLAPLGLPLKFDEPSPLLLVPDAGGHLMEADVVDLAANPNRRRHPTCGFLVRPGQTTKIPMTSTSTPSAGGVRFDYFAELPTQVQVRTDSDRSTSTSPRGCGACSSRCRVRSPRSRSRRPESATPVCVTQVFIGGFGASDRPCGSDPAPGRAVDARRP